MSDEQAVWQSLLGEMSRATNAAKVPSSSSVSSSAQLPALLQTTADTQPTNSKSDLNKTKPNASTYQEPPVDLSKITMEDFSNPDSRVILGHSESSTEHSKSVSQSISRESADDADIEDTVEGNNPEIDKPQADLPTCVMVPDEIDIEQVSDHDNAATSDVEVALVTRTDDSTRFTQPPASPNATPTSTQMQAIQIERLPATITDSSFPHENRVTDNSISQPVQSSYFPPPPPTTATTAFQQQAATAVTPVNKPIFISSAGESPLTVSSAVSSPPRVSSFVSSTDAGTNTVKAELYQRHSQHIAETRAYYERHISELKGKISDLSAENIDLSMSLKRASRDCDVAKERANHLSELLTKSNSYTEELESRLRQAEARIDFFSARFEKTEAEIRSLHDHSDELQSWLKDREEKIADLEATNSELTAALHDSRESENAQAVTETRDEALFNRLLADYEELGHVYELTKTALRNRDSQLEDSRTEISQLRRGIFKLEMELERFQHKTPPTRSPQTHQSSSAVPIKGSPALRPDSSPPPVPRTLDYLQRHFLRESSDNPLLLAGDNNFDEAVSPTKKDSGVVLNETSINTQVSGEDSNRPVSPLLKAERQFFQGKDFPGQKPHSHGNSSALSGTDKPDAESNSDIKLNEPFRRRLWKDNSDDLAFRHKPSDTTTTSSSNRIINTADSTTKSIQCDMDDPQYADRLTYVYSKQQQRPTFEKRADPSLAFVSVSEPVPDLIAGQRMCRSSLKSSPIPQAQTSSQTRSRPKNSPAKSRKKRTEDALEAIRRMERSMDKLLIEKIEVESALSRIPSGYISSATRSERERLENKLDSIDRKLGSVRMQLRKHHVI